MTFPILGGNGAVAGYQIDNSLRFNDGDSPQLYRSTGTTNKKIFTVSVWAKRCTNGARQTIWASDKNTNDTGDGSKGGSGIALDFWNDDKFYLGAFGGNFQIRSNGLQRDNSAWYHIVAGIDTTQSDQNNRAKLYINGENVSSLSAMVAQNTDVKWAENRIGVKSATANYSDSDFFTQYLDSYIAELHVIDGTQLQASDFGEYDDTGIWKPKEYSGSYGSDGYYLDFENSGSLGADQSGNGNNFTPTNLASTDQTTDTPTNNFATMNSLANSSYTTISEGNLKLTGNTATDNGNTESNFSVSTGKWYWEVKATTTSSPYYPTIGILKPETAGRLLNSSGGQVGVLTDSVAYESDGDKRISNVSTASFNSFTSGDIIGIALDMDNGAVYFSKNGTWENSGVPTSGASKTNASHTWTPDNRLYQPACASYNSSVAEVNFGNPSFSISSGNSDGNGYGNFEYAPPSGFLALCTQNLATELSPTIDDGSQYFNTVLYTGTGSDLSITGVGFQPDWTWIKSRSNANNHNVFDSSRGQTNRLYPNLTDAEDTVSGFTLDSDGFSTGTSSIGDINVNGATYASWNWLGGTTSSNTDGSITSTVQANTTAGFSVVTYTGTGANATIGHGLGVAPKMIICKQRNNTVAHDWIVYHENIGNTDVLQLNQDYAKGTYSVVWNNTSPTSSVFSVGTAGSVNESGKNQLAYCFADIEGYSKFGAWVGNGSTTDANRPFIYTGFRPAFVLWKDTNSATDWRMMDNKRNTYNPENARLFPNSSSAENSGYSAVMDFLSNGFKIRGTHTTGINTSGNSYIYMAFAESPFVTSSGIPVVAR